MEIVFFKIVENKNKILKNQRRKNRCRNEKFYTSSHVTLPDSPWALSFGL